MTAPDISLGNWFLQRSRRTPNRRALTFEGKTSTYAELQERFDRLAAALKAAGVCRGDRVAFIGLNQPAFFEVMFAAARIGAIFVPLNFRLTGPELDYIINDAGVHTIVADSPHRGVIDGIRATCRAGIICRPTSMPPVGRRSTTFVGKTAPLAERRADRRRRSRGHHVHLRHDRAAEGRHADPRQYLVEQQHELAHHRRAGDRRDAGGGAAVPHRRLERHHIGRVPEGRARSFCIAASTRRGGSKTS